MRRAGFVAALILALAAGPTLGDEPRPVEIPSRAAAAIDKAAPHVADAEKALAARDWAAAVAAYEKALAALGEDEAIGGFKDRQLYNLACAHARLGHVAEAAAAFAASVKSGLRPSPERGPTGAWASVPGLSLPHLLADADLDPIRKETAYLDALKPLVAAGAPVVEFTDPERSSLSPAVIVLAAEDEDAERALPAWRVAAKGRGVALVAVAGPVRATPKERRWILGDGDERWAVAKIAETLDAVAKDPRIDGRRVFLVGVGARPGEAAWAAATSESKRLAGFAAPGARFHAAWHADAVAALPTTFRVALGASDEKPAAMLKERGIDAARVPTSKDESAVAAAILDAMLGKP